MKDNFSYILKNAGLKITPARLAILALFSKECGPIDAFTVFKKLKNKHIDQVTVYRTLTSFLEKAIVVKVNLRKDSVYYELNNHHHHHIVCNACGAIEEFAICDVAAVTEKVIRRSKLFNRIDQHSLELFGVCKSCK